MNSMRALMQPLANKLALVLLVALPLLVFLLWAESFSSTKYLSLVTLLLLVCMLLVNLIVSHNNVLINPMSVFSLMYAGFVVGGFYYAFSDGYFGKFIAFMDMDRALIEHYLVVGQLYAMVCFLFFSVGYLLFHRIHTTPMFDVKSSFDAFLQRYYLHLSVPLLWIGLVYWLWVCNTIAGGVIEAFQLFQLFPHLVAEHHVSTLPYLLYYAGVYVLLMGLIINHKKLGKLFFLISMLGFLIAISTARVTISLTFLLSQIYLVYLLVPDARSRSIKIITALFSLAFVIYFLRIASNLYFLGREFSLADLNFLQAIVGGGNVTDLQQLVIIFFSFDMNQALLGSTYFDWLRNTFGGFFGIEPSSIGLIIQSRYVSGDSGAPTPTAIGEAFANFNIAAPLFMSLVGMALACVHHWANRQTGVVALFIYASFIVNFVFMYPKVDSTMFANFFWAAAPTVMILLVAYWIFYLLKRGLQS